MADGSAPSSVSGPLGTTSAKSIILKALSLIGLLYLFLLSITLIGVAFKLMGKDMAMSIFQATSNPVVGLVIGILTTALVQSSSTTTSIIVGLVAAGTLNFENAIPLVMGANIGTTVTNTLVSMGHIGRGDDFRRAFAGSTVHDFFNICAVLVLLPLQQTFGLISRSAHSLESVFAGFGGLKFGSPLKAITKPVATEIGHLLGDVGWIATIVALFMMFVALRYIVKVLKSMVLSKVERFFQRYIFRTPALGFILGILLTVMVQSSSITTSLVVPLIGAGVLSLHRVFPYMLGANIGTTITAFLASFVTGSHEAVSIAFAHLIFNVYGIAIFWPLKKIPIWLAEKLSELTMKSRLVPIVYILVMFFAIPGVIIYFMR